jgi:hypothetical protein
VATFLGKKSEIQYPLTGSEAGTAAQSDSQPCAAACPHAELLRVSRVAVQRSITLWRRAGKQWVYGGDPR